MFRREETARIWKLLSEKKLEDEKAETINHVPKKRSGTRNRLNPPPSAEDRAPATHTGNGTPAEGKVDEEENGKPTATPRIGGGGSSRSNGANRLSHTDALPLDLNTETFSRLTARR